MFRFRQDRPISARAGREATDATGWRGARIARAYPRLLVQLRALPRTTAVSHADLIDLFEANDRVGSHASMFVCC